MGLFDAVRAAFGRKGAPERWAPDAPFAPTASGRERLAQLAPGVGIHVEARPEADLWRVVVTEGPSEGPPPPGLDDLPITVSDEDLERLTGCRLSWEGGWRVEIHLTLHGRATPNPDSRAYVADRILATGHPASFAAGSPAPALAGRLLALRGVRTVLLRDEQITIGRVPGTPWEELDLAVERTVRTWCLGLGEPLHGEARPLPTEGLEADVMAVLQERVLPGIHRDGGDLRLVGVHDGIAQVSLHGACKSCPSSTATLRHAVERALVEAFPGRIVGVESV